MKNILDKILLGDNVVEEFHQIYNNPEFKKWVLSILPEIEACENLKQDNPWHIYNCLDHILHSVEEINKQTKGLCIKLRKMLAYTMFLHDIGKPQCYLRRFSKFYGREVDSFFDHNLASEKIAERVLPQFNFNKKEQEIIKLLIHEHDIFMFITLEDDGNKYHKVLTKQLLNDYIAQYNKVDDGKKLLKYLIMVGKSDNLAQNPEMTNGSLRMLEKMDKMIEINLLDDNVNE